MKKSLLGGVKKSSVEKSVPEKYRYFEKDVNLTIGEGDEELLFNEQKYDTKNSISFQQLKLFTSQLEFITFKYIIR